MPKKIDFKVEKHEIPGGFVESGTVIMGGRQFTAGGAMVTGPKAAGYPKKMPDGRLALTAFGGDVLGYGRVLSSWPCRGPRGMPCWQGERIYQMEFEIDGRRYSGRGFGTGMLWRGRHLQKRSRWYVPRGHARVER